MVRPIANARQLNPSPDSGWGLHLVDVNVALGNLQQAVDAQIASYLRAQRLRPRIALRLRFARGRDGRGRACADPPVIASVAGRDRQALSLAVFRVNGRPVKRDLRRPFSLRLGAARLGAGHVVRVAVRGAFENGRARLVGRRLRICA